MSNLPFALFSSQLESLRCCNAKQTGCVVLYIIFETLRCWFCMMLYAYANVFCNSDSSTSYQEPNRTCSYYFDVQFALWAMNQLPLQTSGNWMISQLLLQKLKIYWTSSRVMKAECPKLFFAVLRRSSARHDLTQGAGCDRSTRRR